MYKIYHFGELEHNRILISICALEKVPESPLPCLSVNAIIDVKNELLQSNPDNEVLRSWSGDPCLPVSWPRLFCQPANGSPVITTV
jgi:hypothetical protein